MSFIRSVTTVGSYTLLSRLTGFVRDVLTATYMGAGATADAFFIAFQFPDLFRSLFAEGLLGELCPDIYANAGARWQAKAKQFADDAFAVLAAALLVFSVIMIIAMPVVLYVMAPGFADIPAKWNAPPNWRASRFPICFCLADVPAVRRTQCV